MADTKLTVGALEQMFTGGDVENPVLQVLGFKLVQAGTSARYRLLVSDSRHSTGSAMLATQLNDMVDEQLKTHAVIKVDRFLCNTVHANKKVLILLGVTVIADGATVGGTIGSPVSYSFDNAAGESANVNQRVPLGTSLQQNGGQTASPARPTSSTVGIHPIASLTPYQNKWTIRARVTNKSAIRTWSNSRGEGKLFSMDLLDQSGEIKATAFNDQCDKFYDMIELDKVYNISVAQLKTANKQYSSLKNDYEMTFNAGTQVSLCQENTDIPTMQFEFVSINQIEKLEKDNVVDIIGVCKEADELSTVVQKATGRELKKRDLQLLDNTGTEIRLTIWGNQAENFDGSLHPIVAVKGAKISDFNGKSLSLLSSSTLQINPDIKESHKLRAWYENAGGEVKTVNLSNQKSSVGGLGSNYKTIGEAILEKLGCEQADYYSTKATPSLIRKENCLYPACPADNCNKKVIDMNNGVYRCEKCNKEYENFNWRLMLNVSLADGTDNVWAVLFQDQAETLLGCTAATLGDLRESDPDAFQNIFNEASFKEFVFRFRVKMETYNDESRLKTTVASVQPLDCNEYNRKLIQEIKTMAGLN